ncbi:MAG: gamma-glutamyl-gamma-aminobutyrate hydrolase family protein [Magnetococcales bacterium]|nr:gamma-glutamyl-gamma-aminobutyrate hydrolase family protein [Magnetococcales bacterium]
MRPDNAPFKVAVSQRVDILADREERRDALDQQLIRWLWDAVGVLPIPVPNLLTPDQLESFDQEQESGLLRWLTELSVDGIVLSGGNDIGTIKERDRTERILLAFARERRLPLLGICRGMQMMTVVAGGRLREVVGHVRTRHRLVFADTGHQADVNSYHNLSIVDCPPGYDLLSVAEDGVIEAIRHQYLPWEGWMWHPERTMCFDEEDTRRLRQLLILGMNR